MGQKCPSMQHVELTEETRSNYSYHLLNLGINLTYVDQHPQGLASSSPSHPVHHHYYSHHPTEGDPSEVHPATHYCHRLSDWIQSAEQCHLLT